MKLFGHPIHPLLIHFPTALLPMDLVLTILYHSTGHASFYEAGFYSLAGAVLMGGLAVLTGLVELLAMPRSEKKALALALYHGFLNGLVLAAFGLMAYKAWQAFPAPHLAGTTGIIIKSVLILALFIGNYMGGRLIYHYHIGINPNTPHDGKTPA